MIEIREWVTPVVIGAYPHETVQKVVLRMQQHHIGSVIVIDTEKKPLGIFTERDLLNKVVAQEKDPKTTLLKEVMTAPIETVNISRPVLEVFKLFAERDFRHLPVSLDDGRIVGVLSLRSKAFIQEICRIMTMLQNVNELKSHFLANVSHELKTPLISITRSASLLLENHKNSEKELNKDEIQHFLEIIERQGHHLQLLIGDLLDITALEAGKMRLKKHNIDLMPLIQQAVKNTKILADRKGVKIGIDAKTQDTTIFADESRIIQVLINLIDNAVKFTPPGGQINIHVHTEDQTRKSLRVAVKDTGIGIPEEKMRLIFERFEQAHDPTIGNQSGTGLGLTIVKEIVGLHSGKIWVESEENKGSTFYFTLPQTEEATVPSNGNISMA
ncbi:MAG: CBS domain-containing protein [Candidatus Omnitrophica bacterium]|nr:CBS domain-containing protein [Candidatus Omnitrophota bacterium]